QIGEHFHIDDADVAIIAYGCVARSAKRAVSDCREKGIKAGMLKLNTIWPFMRTDVEKVLRRAKVVIVPEMNMGQYSREVKRVNKGEAKVFTINRVDGTIITPQEIMARIKEVF
ncbi:MAG TPA: transketolase C-terminal domain-containing protein, partial [Syntrophorhabdaceae bacterium]|nr:transketolase C-terminal domain-containing protein [Syntrophorhabdaceae bacterium]